MKNSLNGSVVTSLQGCTDVNITPGAGDDGKAVTYDHASGKFILSVAAGGISNIEDADDVNVSLGAGVDEYALCYDHDTTKFVLRQVTIGACLLATGATVGASSQAQAFTNGVKTGLIFPASDSTTALKITKANGSTRIINVDTTNARVGIGTNAPTEALHVVGRMQLDFLRINGGVNPTTPASGAGFESSYFTEGYAGGLNGGNGVSFFTSTDRSVGGIDAYRDIWFNAKSQLFNGNVAGSTITFGHVTTLTNTCPVFVFVDHLTSGTPAAGFGIGQLFKLKSSTTAAQSAGLIEVLWYEAAHATRKADLVLSAYDTDKRECIRIRGNGSAATIGFLGATPAARIAHIADAVTTHAVTDPADSPADADALREDLVTNVVPSIETQLNNLGAVINSILTTLETFGLHATS